ncbi:hypothetical protein ACJIZ3_019405 [Penstemon smallii]|uniref:Glutamate receptor n=1 Tax=Penstemon smallii TaxID=265156 RepID=A0ABD3T1P9_9LAMI
MYLQIFSISFFLISLVFLSSPFFSYSPLSLLKDVEVDAIIGPQKSSQSTFVIGLGDKANVPIISFSATSPSLHPQTHYFIQTAIIDSYQVGAIVAIVKYFQWSQVVLINEESDYGNGINPYLSNALYDANARVSYRSVIPLEASDDFMLQELYKMKTMQTRVFVVHMSSSIASKFFMKVKEAGMMREGYVWIITSALTDLLYSLDSRVIETMQGVLGVKPLIPSSRRLGSTAKRWKRKFIHDNPDSSQVEFGLYGIWAYDALWALAMAAERVQFREHISPSKNTSILNTTNMFAIEISKTGPKLREALSEVTFKGLGGKFHLVNGQLEPSSFQILNVVGKGEREVGVWTHSEGILSDRNADVTNSSSKRLKSVVFPGETTDIPKGWEVPVSGKKLRVGVPIVAGFEEFVKVEKDRQTNVTKVSGCYIDMFDAVMAELPYAMPHEYIPFETLDGLSAGSYDDLCHQVFLQKYDVAVGDITITSKRSNFVDFSLPFEAGGVTMTVLKNNPNNAWLFVKPLSLELWLTAMVLFFFTGVVLWILEHRFNSAFRGPPEEHVALIFYFPFMSLVYAQRERIVSNLARLVVVVWMLVVLVLNSTYTANLSARLTIKGLEPANTDVNALIRNGEYVGCRKGSFIYDFLQDQGFDKGKIKPYSSPEDIHKALSKGTKKGGISALFAVKPYAALFLSTYKNKYITKGITYPTEGFAYAFQKGSPIVTDVSRAVTKLTENHKFSQIQKKWLGNPESDAEDGAHDPSQISLTSFKALFAISGGVTATCLLVFIATYLYKNRDFVQRISNSSTSILSKARALFQHFDQRDPKSFRSSNYREDGANTAPSINENTRSSRVVPISTMNFNDANGDTSPTSEHATAPSHQTRSTDRIEIVTQA